MLLTFRQSALDCTLTARLGQLNVKASGSVAGKFMVAGRDEAVLKFGQAG
jgi:hypothetical protein